MGFFRRKIKNPIVGTAHITSCGSPGNPRAIRSTCVLFVVVEGPGLVPTAHELRKQVRVARWPSPGMTLPCEIDPNDPARFRIDFDAIADWQDNARGAAAQVAAARANLSTQTPRLPTQNGGVTVIGATSPEAAEEAIVRAEGVLAMDLNGDGRIGP